MVPPHSGETIFLRNEGRRAYASGLPPDVLAQAARRLRVLALLYAFVFFMAGFFPALLGAGDRAYLFAEFSRWGPGALSITLALVVAALTRSPAIPLPVVMIIGLGFEVASSYGIAAAEFLDPTALNPDARWLGLSWVAVWVMLFTIAVPSPPRRAALVTLASVSSVPAVVGYLLVTHQLSGLSPPRFFFGLVFPYLLVSLMAWVGARVVYELGSEVTRARALGGYRLIELLGTGGMGEVWRAQHHLLARPAAIKLVRADALGTAQPEARGLLQRRLEREAQSTAALRSPHTVELYDFGIANDGTFYIVMELLDGFDMQTLVERFGPLPAGRAVALLAQVCHSLGEAHAEGLIHRDIKPANVFVCRHGREYDFVKVLDFGMVKSQREPDGSDPWLTGEQAVGGTPAFMAPEQVLGDRLLDGRTDIYGVGCLAYWLLTGRLVFTGVTSMDLMVQHTHAQPVPPSAHAEGAVPAALDRLVLACLAKNPDDRPASADALAAALAALDGGSPWGADQAQAWWNRHHPGSNLAPGPAGTQRV